MLSYALPILASVAATTVLAAPAIYALDSRSVAPSAPSSSAQASTSQIPASASAPAPVTQASFSPEQIAAISNAPTNVRRFQLLLTKDGAGQSLLDQADLTPRIVFDFNNAPAQGEGGSVKSANVGAFPILTDLGISITFATLEPCGINTPHTHPRATEFLTVVDGPGVSTGFILENGLVGAGQPAEVTATVGKFQGTVFPVGSIHYQFNNNCQNTTFLASLSSEDPGTSQVAQNFLNLNGDVVRASIGFGDILNAADFDTVKKSIPANLAREVEKCAATCGIQKN